MISSSTRNIAGRYLAHSFVTVDTGSPDTSDMTNRHMPNGGVTIPEIRATVIITPKCTWSSPRLLMIGIKMGVISKIAAVVSIKHPTMTNMTASTSSTNTGPAEYRGDSIFCSTVASPSFVMIQVKNPAMAMISIKVPDVSTASFSACIKLLNVSSLYTIPRMIE